MYIIFELKSQVTSFVEAKADGLLGLAQWNSQSPTLSSVTNFFFAILWQHGRVVRNDNRMVVSALADEYSLLTEKGQRNARNQNCH